MYQSYDDNLCKEALRVLKPNGYFLYNESVFQKRDGQFCHIPRDLLFAELGFGAIPLPNRGVPGDQYEI